MATWADLEAAAPDIAVEGRRLLYRSGEGEALLATVRDGAAPRIHPINVGIVGGELVAFIKRSELARDRNDQRSDRFQVGQKVDARVVLFDRRAHKVQLSIKALEVQEEKEAIAQYGSSDSGATLGDILAHALKRKGEEAETETETEDAKD